MKRLTIIYINLFLLLIVLAWIIEAAHKKEEQCLLPMQSGRCFGYVQSYAYDPYARKCKEFIYGGCGGNENRFLTKAECERQCRDV